MKTMSALDVQKLRGGGFSWSGEQFWQSGDYTLHLTKGHIKEILQALDSFKGTRLRNKTETRC